MNGLVNPSSGDTVTFNLYSSATEQDSSTLLFSSTQPLNFNGVTGTASSPGYTATATSTDYWVATFNGDSNNSPVSSGATSEPVTITPNTPAINTSQQPASAVVGSSVADTATVTGLVNASSGDTVTFTLYSSATVQNSSTLLFSSTQPLSVIGGTGTSTSAGYTAAATGTDYWVATFNGDSNNNAVTSGATAEPVAITPNSPGINTSQQPASAVVGSSVADKATVTGLVNAGSGDTVTFTLYSSATVQNSSTLLFSSTQPVTVSGGMGTSTSAGYTAAATGTDYWVATFNGDSNNNAVTSGATAEPVTITPNSPGINTSQQPASAVVGSSVADKATVTGLVNAGSGDTVTFKLYSSATVQNSSTLLYSSTQPVTVSGGMGTATSAGYTAAATGTDYWVATFNGDSNNNAVASGATAEPVTITKASSSVSTAIYNASTNKPVSGSQPLGTSVYDTATVTATPVTPTGTVTYYFYTTATPVYGTTTPLTTQIVMLTGTGSVPNSSSTGGLGAGSYSFIAVYSGDSNYTAYTGMVEPLTIGTPNVTVTKTADCSQIAPGTSAGYTVTITNTGSVTATGVTLSDALPAGKGNDIKWSIDTTTGNPVDFTIGGSTGSQTLQLSSAFLVGDSLAPTQSISVHITAATYADDVCSTCTVSSSIPCNFNGASIPGGDYIWFECAVCPTGLSSTSPTSINFSNQTISFTYGGQNYSVPVPNGCVTYSSNCSTASSTFNSGSNSWISNCPEGLSGNEFICGVPFQVPAGGFSGGISNVNWSATCGADANVGVKWDWSATCFSNFSANCSILGVKPCDNSGASQFKNSDQCGTPEWYKCYETNTCGSNGCGSWSSQCTATPSCECGGSCTLTNTAIVSATGQTPMSSAATITITTCLQPQVTVTKTADSSTVTAGGAAGYTVTITNTSGIQQATSVTLSDPLPSGLGNDISWTINGGSNPSDFTIAGSTGSQNLTLASGISTSAPAQSISVHITGTTNVDDASAACSTTYSIPCSFNATALPGGDYLWFSCAVNCTGLSSSGSSTISLAGQTISFTSGGTTYNLPVPNGTITYAPNGTASTTFNGNTNSWITDCGEGLAGNEFICGVPFQVPAGGLSGGIKNVTWTGSCSAGNGVGVNLQWAAACYNIFTSSCGAIAVKPCDSSSASQYKDSDHCGSPENFTSYVTGGACGGGGSNYTGSYSATCGLKPTTNCGGAGTLTNIATVDAMCQSPVSAAATITVQTSGITISGVKYLDSAGDGFIGLSLGYDTGLGGVTIDLYKGSYGGTPFETTVTASNGTYGFTGLAAGTYYVQEVVPQGYVQTGGGPNGTAGNTYYTITASGTNTYGGNNFADYLTPTCTPTNVSYSIKNGSKTTKVSMLDGNTLQGETVTVTFTVSMVPEQLTLVSYNAPSSTWNPATAYQQTIYQQATGTYTSAGTYSLTVQTPNNHYQIDFVCGPAICMFIPQTFNGSAYGPDNVNISYHTQNRYLDSDNE